MVPNLGAWTPQQTRTQSFHTHKYTPLYLTSSVIDQLLPANLYLCGPCYSACAKPVKDLHWRVCEQRFIENVPPKKQHKLKQDLGGDQLDKALSNVKYIRTGTFHIVK